MNVSNIAVIQLRGPQTWPYVQPPIFESFWFEKFNAAQQVDWMENNYKISFYICAVYLILIYIGKKFMKDKTAFNLQLPYALWNLGLTVFSVAGLVRCLPELLFVLSKNNGFHQSVCVRDSHNEPAAFWAWLFTLSKVVELGDTAFMVLRKKTVNPVHYVHHGLALILCWFLYPIYEPVVRYGGTFNFFIHSVLYSYLFLKAIGVEMPRYFSKVILSLELMQLIIGLTLNSYAIWIKAKGEQCEHRLDVIFIETLVYLLYGTVLVKYISKFINRSREKLEKSM